MQGGGHKSLWVSLELEVVDILTAVGGGGGGGYRRFPPCRRGGTNGSTFLGGGRGAQQVSDLRFSML